MSERVNATLAVIRIAMMGTAIATVLTATTWGPVSPPLQCQAEEGAAWAWVWACGTSLAGHPTLCTGIRTHPVLTGTILSRSTVQPTTGIISDRA